MLADDVGVDERRGAGAGCHMKRLGLRSCGAVTLLTLPGQGRQVLSFNGGRDAKTEVTSLAQPF